MVWVAKFYSQDQRFAGSQTRFDDVTQYLPRLQKLPLCQYSEHSLSPLMH
ncbi:MAG: hypothetical protein OFPI_28950 [Osedax symbiont Rs2]|nr:MAG: hypothetical protein OFPI_28950 [Osedax symbiont Rs2]